MKKTEIIPLLRLLAVPAALMVLGAVLMLFPDTAAILTARLISWMLTGAGICYALGAILGRREKRLLRIITGAFCLILGSALLVNPLFLAANLGRVLGIVLAFEGIQNLTRRSAGKPMALLTFVGAVILILAPMTASRMVFALCGLLLLVIGGAQLLERLRRWRLSQSRDKNIIDAL